MYACMYVCMCVYEGDAAGLGWSCTTPDYVHVCMHARMYACMCVFVKMHLLVKNSHVGDTRECV